jgi:hypothetical protein
VRTADRFAVSCLGALLGLLAMSSPAAAAPKPISGKLSKSGYTVIAMAANGKARVVLARRGRFKLRPPARRVTLHLRASNGKYAGPIVVGRKKKGMRAVLGVRAGAQLGRIRVGPGYAKVLRRPRKKWTDAKRVARARRGVPVGAGNFGFVRSKRPRASVPGDSDADGIPGSLDIDDDGDLILDNLDRSAAKHRARAAQVSGCGPANIYCPVVSTGLPLNLRESVNANAGSSVAEIDTALRLHGRLKFDLYPTGSYELDCAGDPSASPPRPGLVYCSSGGTGTASAGYPGQPSFPGPPGGTFDRDRDGFGLMDPSLEPLACGSGPCPGAFFLLHGARSDQIGSGDVMLEHLATDGNSSRCPPPPGTTRKTCVSFTGTLQYVFATTQALAGYSDTAGNSATLTYPVAPNGPGTEGNGLPVAPGPDGDIRVTLTFWRPQRKPIGSGPRRESCLDDSPPCEWVDVGHLTYGVSVQEPNYCPQTAFSENDPNLTTATPHLFLHGGGGFDDTKNDEASRPGDTSPARTFSYTLNLSKCLGDLGVPFSTGSNLTVSFNAAPGDPSTVTQIVTFRRQ